MDNQLSHILNKLARVIADVDEGVQVQVEDKPSLPDDDSLCCSRYVPDWSYPPQDSPGLTYLAGCCHCDPGPPPVMKCTNLPAQVELNGVLYEAEYFCEAILNGKPKYKCVSSTCSTVEGDDLCAGLVGGGPISSEHGGIITPDGYQISCTNADEGEECPSPYWPEPISCSECDVMEE